jgi:hypothetical protein
MVPNTSLKKAMIDNLVNGNQAAFACGMSPDRFSKITNGHIIPSQKEKSTIASFLNKSIFELFSEKVEA